MKIKLKKYFKIINIFSPLNPIILNKKRGKHNTINIKILIFKFLINKFNIKKIKISHTRLKITVELSKTPKIFVRKL